MGRLILPNAEMLCTMMSVVDYDEDIIAGNTSTPNMYYNVEVLEQAGLTELPLTWADILDAGVAQ
jgi:ABC-type glycerol-3-phosphate transport system substrate-binding protein